MQRRTPAQPPDIESPSTEESKYHHWIPSSKTVAMMIFVVAVVTIGIWEGIKYHILPDPAICSERSGLNNEDGSSDERSSATPLSIFPIKKAPPLPGQPGRFACPAPSPAVPVVVTEKRTPRPRKPVMTLSLADAEELLLAGEADVYYVQGALPFQRTLAIYRSIRSVRSANEACNAPYGIEQPIWANKICGKDGKPHPWAKPNVVPQGPPL